MIHPFERTFLSYLTSIMCYGIPMSDMQDSLYASQEKQDKIQRLKKEIQGRDYINGNRSQRSQEINLLKHFQLHRIVYVPSMG
jgi:hypothetical protein